MLLASVTGGAFAQTDVTNKLVNPSFETGTVGDLTSLDGWTLPSLGTDFMNISLGDAASCNGNGYGVSTASDGSKYFFNRKGWSSVATSLSQKVTLPVGKYYLSVDYKGIQKGGTTSKLGFAINGKSILTTQPYYAAADSKGTFAQTDPWKTIGAWFDVSEEGEVTIEITETLEGGSARADLYLDNVKLYQWDSDDEVNYSNASTTSPMDVTAKFVTNPYFDSNTNGWTSTTDYQNKGRATNQGGAISGGFWENWNPSAKTSGKMYQSLTGLADGKYKLTAAVVVNSTSANVSLYIGNKQTKITSDTPSFYSVEGTVSGGTAEIGLVLGEGNAANWIGLDNVKLEYLGYDPESALAALAEQIAAATFTEKHSGASETALQTAITAAQALVTAGTGTKVEIETASANLSTAVAAVNTSIADYAKLNAQIALAEPYSIVNPANVSAYAQAIADAKDGYANETIEDCAATIKNLTDYKVADYTYVSDNFKYSVDLDEKAWKTTGYVADFDNQHWSGTEHQYKNQDDSNGRGWNSSTGFTIGLNQDVTLPAGKYVFKACGRKSAGATMELSVKAGSTDLGTVTDFPNGSSARGINKNGETSFDEGNDAYANNGNGFGWQWRFIAFELTEETTINVSVSASATVAHEWASFGDYSVITDNEANLAMMTYNVALNSAKIAIANDTYKNVTGLEKSNLQTLIDADMTGKTSTEIESATTELKSATTAFTAAAPAYDAFIATMAMVENLDADGKKYFNSNSYVEMLLEAYDANEVLAEYFAELENVFKAAIKNQSANSDWTGLLVNPSFEDATGTFPNGWTTERNTTGSFDYKLLEETLNTNETTDGKYVLNAWAPQINYIYVKQSVNLPVGVYRLSAAVYSDKVKDQHVEAIADGTSYKSATVANNNWETLSTTFVVYKDGDVTVGIFSNGNNLNGDTYGWFRADNFKLTYLGSDIPVTIGESGYASFSATSDVVAPEGVEAFYASEVTETSVKMTKIEGGKIPANTGVILKAAKGEYTLTATTETLIQPAGNLLVAVTSAKKELAATEGSNTNYVLKNGQFVTWTEGVKTNVAAGKAYLSVPSSSAALSIDFGDATAINTVNANTFNGARVNLAGQVVGNGYKGIVIENGKKVLVK